MGKVCGDASGQILNVTGSILRDGVIETGGYSRNGRVLEQEEEFSVSRGSDY